MAARATISRFNISITSNTKLETSSRSDSTGSLKAVSEAESENARKAEGPPAPAPPDLRDMWSVQHSNPWRADTLLRAFITLSSTGMAEAEHSNDGSLILREPSADGEANGGPPSGAAPGKIFPVDSLVENLLPLPKATGSHREQMTAGIPRQRGVSAGVIFRGAAYPLPTAPVVPATPSPLPDR